MTTEEILSRLDGGETLEEILATDMQGPVTSLTSTLAHLSEYIEDLIALRDSGSVTNQWWVNNYQGERKLAEAQAQLSILQQRLAEAEAAYAAQQEVNATRLDFHRSVRLLHPYLGDDLALIYADAWAENNGNGELAMATVIADARFDQYFPGLKREDGTLRSSIVEYKGTMATYEDVLLEVGINPAVFATNLAGLFAGEVSGDEFRARVEAVEERVVSQEEEIRATYADFYGLALDRASLIASALDPEVSSQILNRQISIAEIGGEAALQKFALTRTSSEGLWAAGVTREGARGLFQQAGAVLPGLGRASMRQNEGVFDLDSFIESQVYAAPAQNRRLGRILTGEASLFSSDKADVARSQTGAVTGLRPR